MRSSITAPERPFQPALPIRLLLNMTIIIFHAQASLAFS
jgi:hypothetical protein